MKSSSLRISAIYLLLIFTVSPFFSFLAHELAHAAYSDHHSSTSDHPDVQLQEIDSVILQKQILPSPNRGVSQHLAEHEFSPSLSNQAILSKYIRGRDSPNSDICSHYHIHPSQAPPA